MTHFTHSKCRGCRAAREHLRSICNAGLATDSATAFGVCTDRYKWLVHPSGELLTRLSVPRAFGISSLDMKLQKNLWLWQWQTGVDVLLQLKNKPLFIFKSSWERPLLSKESAITWDHYNGKGVVYRLWSNSVCLLGPQGVPMSGEHGILILLWQEQGQLTCRLYVHWRA